MPLELGVRIALPLYCHVVTERLADRPVRATYEWLQEVFGPGNPWFSRRLNLETLPISARAPILAEAATLPHYTLTN